MKIKIAKGMPAAISGKVFANVFKKIMDNNEADAIGNITLIFDLYKDGVKIDNREEYSVGFSYEE